MATYILGISAFYHDSAAALLRDGEIIAAAQEERFTRKKHDHSFPRNAVDYCLAEAGISPVEIDYVAFYDKPLTKFDRLVQTYATYAPKGFQSFMQAIPIWLRTKLHLPSVMDRALGGQYKGRYLFTEHHESHAASAFFPSPFEEAAIMTLDGVGEWSTTSLGHGKNNRINLLQEIRFPHSLGLLYSAFTYYTGFRVNSGEYKVMGLAPYGKPRFRDLIVDHLIDIKEDGSFWMDMSYFNYCQGMTMTSDKFHRLFGSPPRRSESEISQREMDLAASVQVVCEEVMLKCASHLHKSTGSKNLVMAGGVALNCVGNGRILREGPFENVWIQPASGDAGGALGAAQIVHHHVLSEPRVVQNEADSMSGSYLGPAFGQEDIDEILKRENAVYQSFANDEELVDALVPLLEKENVVGWFQGRMEFGPRALGGRSILGDARSEKLQKVMNLKIKFRESFRPFAPSILAGKAHDYFEIPENADSPYMLIVAPVLESHREPGATNTMAGLEGLNKLNVKRSVVPAITHVDFSARVQTIHEETNPRYHRLLTKFYDKTASPVLVNTSFNIRGEPIVCTPEDAYRCFMGTDMDVLVLENTILLKSDQPKENIPDRKDYQSQFALD
ncbi:MAG: carbamoyltransferase [Verrucomicrobiota bacterium]